MLRLIIGKAGTGKTSAIIEEIRCAVENKTGKRIMLVPEQYSHEAERELCRRCGDTLSLYAEVFSFTGLARRIRSQLGGSAEEYLDKGGRLLCMSLALSAVGSRLKVYSAAARNSELQSELLDAIDELKSACIGTEKLLEIAESCDDALGDKLADLALIYEAFEGAVANGHADPADMLTLLAAQIPDCELSADSHIYIDGFIDFTAQQINVITALMKKSVNVTVCLTVDDMNGDNEIFELSRRAARQLSETAKEMGVEVGISVSDKEWNKNDSLGFYCDKLFSYSAADYGGESAVSLYRAENMTQECELAAAKALELVRDKNCRWRDIAVAVRGFDDYAGVLSDVFERYGVPLYINKKTELLSRPLPLMTSLVYDIIHRGWDTDDVISYMHTGLSGLSASECDILEGYIFKWQLRAGAWMRTDDWNQHPDGYGCEYDDDAKERLREINSVRRRFSAPILNFHKRMGLADTAEGQCSALAGFYSDLKLPELLEKRAAELEEAGQSERAREYQQLWGLIVSALEQTAAILGDRPMNGEEFSKLFTLMLSKYDIGTIPVSLDRVSAGDFDRMRRRSIKHLIVLGACDTRLPRSDEAGGVFTDSERRRLSELDLTLGADGDGELWREFSLIYHCFTLPSDTLTLCYSTAGEDGAALRPAFVFNRAAALFGMEAQKVNTEKVRMSAEAPALLLASRGIKGGSGAENAAREYFEKKDAKRCEALKNAAEMQRGNLSPKAVRALYGDRLRLSASRIDKFASCKFSYFCQYGLKAKPYEPAGFKPPEIGTFMHYVLENLAREVKELGGFKKVSDEEIGRLTDKYVEKYVQEELNDFREKSARFVHLFRRLCRDVRTVAADTAAELRRSDFQPLDFELNFGDAQKFRPVELGDGETSMTLTGVADRVDGWLHDGKLYLRVVDYKTGRKKFSLSDVWYGMGLQMLLYLFALEADGKELYGHEIVPAGVMYLPARNALLSAEGDISGEEASEARHKELRRSGLVLDDAGVLNAWENGEDKLYIPVKFKKGEPSTDDVASLERLGILSNHIRENLSEMARELKRGSIAADPYYRGQQENACMNCDYFDVCHFSDGENGEHCRYLSRLRPDRVWAMLEGGEENG
ncbi:MAG: PD-(D/E)XK nuclease family protein [Eubacteriales bacterium]|nr:PD-(D/E)XK nuclease family protein [Eubacteriales bacterium]